VGVLMSARALGAVNSHTLGLDLTQVLLSA
jgi:hypothetical protein